MERKGRPVLGAFAGFFFGLAISVLLLVFGVLPLDSIAVVLIPILGLVVGIALGLAAPLGRGGAGRTAAAV